MVPWFLYILVPDNRKNIKILSYLNLLPLWAVTRYHNMHSVG